MPGQRTVCSGKSGISIGSGPRTRADDPVPSPSDPSLAAAPEPSRRQVRGGPAPIGRRRTVGPCSTRLVRGRARRRGSAGEHVVAALAQRLGLVHRDVGVAEQVVDRAIAGESIAMPMLAPTSTGDVRRSVSGAWSAVSSRSATCVAYADRRGCRSSRMPNSSPPSRAARSELAEAGAGSARRRRSGARRRPHGRGCR